MKTTMKTSKIIKMIAVAASLLVFGCAGTGGGYSYNRAAVGGALLDMGRTYTNYVCMVINNHLFNHHSVLIPLINHNKILLEIDIIWVNKTIGVLLNYPHKYI